MKSETIARSWSKAKGASPVVSQAFMSPARLLRRKMLKHTSFLNPLTLGRGKTSDFKLHISDFGEGIILLNKTNV